jgi:hypothetical protein
MPHIETSKHSRNNKLIELLPFDERAASLPPMPADVFDELVGDMVRRGFRKQFPIITHNGKIIEGVNRARACVKAGVEPVYQQFDGKDEDVERFIIQANLCRRHLKPEQRRDLLKKLLRMNPEQSDRAIATMAKVSPTTVGSVRRELGSNVQVGHKDRIEKSGRRACGRRPGSSKPKSSSDITLTTAEYKVEDSPAVELFMDAPDGQQMQKRRWQFLKNAAAVLAYGQVYDGPVDDHVIKVATACRDAWAELVRKLKEEKLSSTASIEASSNNDCVRLAVS